MHTVHMTRKEARSFLVSYQMINTKMYPSKKEGILEVFDRIKSIQYDPLNVVSRNSDLVLQARVKGYKESYLEEALYQDRTLIDGWDKMMGIYQTKDFPFFDKVREERGTSAIDTLKYRLSIEALDYIDDVMNDIKANGPRYSSEINLGETKKHKWGHTKPSSATLDYLFHIGKLGIRTKRNTQKQYDLMERLIGDLANAPSPITSKEEFIRWYILRRIASLGLASLKSGVMWSGLYIDKKKTREKYIDVLWKEGLLTKVIIEELSEDLYALTDSLEYPVEIIDKVSFIAPLDNLLWDRDLVSKLFDFDYRWEVYTPVIKRKYGYYVLPILYKDMFVGRIEFHQQRNSDPLTIKNVWYEEHFKKTMKYEKAFNQAINRFSRYLKK